MSFDEFTNDPDFDATPDAPAPAMRGQFTTAAAALAFIRAGKGVVTLQSKKTGMRFTYRIGANEDNTCLFIKVLTGPDNTADYKYLGRIARDIFWAGRKVPRPGDIARTAASAVAFDWAWRALVKGAIPDKLEIWHGSTCGRCGRQLTVPSSIGIGFGPECRKLVEG